MESGCIEALLDCSSHTHHETQSIDLAPWVTFKPQPRPPLPAKRVIPSTISLQKPKRVRTFEKEEQENHELNYLSKEGSPQSSFILKKYVLRRKVLEKSWEQKQRRSLNLGDTSKVLVQRKTKEERERVVRGTVYDMRPPQLEGLLRRRSKSRRRKQRKEQFLPTMLKNKIIKRMSEILSSNPR